MKQMRIYIFLLFIALLCVSNHPAFAQHNAKTSNDKEIAYHFYKTAGMVPNFERWIKASHPYLSTPIAQSEQVLAEQKIILREEFANFNPDQFPILLNLKTELTLHPFETEEEQGLNIAFHFASEEEKQDLMFFPFEFANDHFAVIIEHFEAWSNISLPYDRYDYLQKNIGTKNDVRVVLELIPTHADSEQPFMVGETPHWLLSSKIGSLIAYNNHGAQLYRYTAPWYLSPVQEEISGLKIRQQEKAKEFEIDIPPILLPIPDAQ